MTDRAQSTKEPSANPTSGWMRVMLWMGFGVMSLVWALEWRSGQISHWDRWLLPLLAAMCGVIAWAMPRFPAAESRLIMAVCVAINGYLVFVFHATMRWMHADNGQWYHVITMLFWLPLGYGLAFVFLPWRRAMLLSAVVMASVFLPLLYWSWTGGLALWMTADGPLMGVVGLANVLYVVLLASVAKLRSSHAKVSTQAQALHKLARTDVLTQLPNRLAMVEALQRASAEQNQHSPGFCVCIVDIDHFKSVNDQHGHAAGDAVLQQVGEVMRQKLRTCDLVGRWGGEEFLIYAPESDLMGGCGLAEHVRSSVARGDFLPGKPVTVSIGVAAHEPGETIDELLARADKALYAAKSSGRNCIQAHPARSV